MHRLSLKKTLLNVHYLIIKIILDDQILKSKILILECEKEDTSNDRANLEKAYTTCKLKMKCLCTTQ